MTIALTADDDRKELIAEFCLAYSGILSAHNLLGTGTTGAIIREATGLDVEQLAPGGLGFQQLIAKAAYNEVDMVFYFRNSGNPEMRYMMDDTSLDFEVLVRVCDANMIPLATNMATAELLVKGLERGDLDWRTLLET